MEGGKAREGREMRMKNRGKRSGGGWNKRENKEHNIKQTGESEQGSPISFLFLLLPLLRHWRVSSSRRARRRALTLSAILENAPTAVCVCAAAVTTDGSPLRVCVCVCVVYANEKRKGDVREKQGEREREKMRSSARAMGGPSFAPPYINSALPLALLATLFVRLWKRKRGG